MRNEQCVFGPLDFAVDAGEALLVQGDNGVGKTTLLRVLAGLLHAETGEVDIDGRRATVLLRASAMSYLGHLPALKPDLSALDNLGYLWVLDGARGGRRPGDARAIGGRAG